jgi:two-component system chemotaxis sensor kinase CheA
MIQGFEALVGEFTLDAQERVERVEQSLLNVPSLKGDALAEEIVRTKRELHTLKGNAGMMGLTELQELAHHMEDVIASADGTPDVAGLLESLDQFRRGITALSAQADAKARTETPAEKDNATPAAKAGGAEQTVASVRVPFSVLDPLLDLIGEMVILRNHLSDTVDGGRRLDPSLPDYARFAADAWSEVVEAQGALSRTLDFVQERVMSLRMTPLQVVLGSLRRLVHDETAKSGKEAKLVTEGGDTPLDKALLELANDALGHLVRNSVIHGLEMPEARVAAGKPRAGRVTVRASAKSGEVWIEVSDDGAGIDREQLRRLARRRGMVVDHLDDICMVLFESGFTTKESADMSAGRGVGLAAVREAVQRQGGEIEIVTELGKGTTFLLRLPLTVSIARALLVEADGEVYAVPLMAVAESRRLRNGDGHKVNNAGVLQWRDELVSLLDLGLHFETAVTPRSEGYVIVVKGGSRHRGLLADAILGVQEVVVKSLDPIVGQPAGVGGSTVLGDGRPILILDPRKLVDVEPFVRG